MCCPQGREGSTPSLGTQNATARPSRFASVCGVALFCGTIPAMSRGAVITFLVTLALGLGAGLYIGWVAAPVQYVNTAPASLRQSAKDDAVLMIAAVYAGDGDREAARARLAELGFVDPGSAVAAAGLRALEAGAAEADVRRLAGLAAAFEPLPPQLQPFQP